MPVYREPLDAAMWFSRVEIIANGALDSVENSLRHAGHLLELTPKELRPHVGLAIAPDDFEVLLDSGDLDGAARHLFAPPGELRIEGGAGAVLMRATIERSALHPKVYGVGDSVAKAALNAWTTCLLSIKARYGESLSGFVQASSAAGDQRVPPTLAIATLTEITPHNNSPLSDDGSPG